MKKILMITGVLVSSTVFAQTTNESAAVSVFPTKGNITAEVGLNLFGDGNTIDFNSYTNGLKTRYFLNNNLAIRFGLGVNNSNKKENVMPGFFPGSDTMPLGTRDFKSNEIIFTPGIEYHLNRNNKLSPYVGLDLIYSKKTVSEDLDNAQMTQNFGFPNPVPSDWFLIYSQNYSAKHENGSSQGERAGTTVGLRLLAGMDYYLSNSLYIGTEFGFDYTKTTNEDYKQTVTYFNWQQQEFTTESRTTPGNESTDTKASVLKGIRIGFKF